MKYLIVGLGNPGVEYANTRHNIGFKVVDALVKEGGEVFSTARLAECAQVKHRGKTLIVIKPNTFMNLSGKAVNYWMQKEHIQRENILVITDDIALPYGKLRLKGKGSDGGHNGLKSIQTLLGTTDYARLRFGVGNNFFRGKQVEYVLGRWSEEERMTMDNRIQTSTHVIKDFCAIGLQRAMNNWNGK